MKISPKSLIDFLYSRKLPQIYREEDAKIKYPLKRFLEALSEGGYAGVIEDIEKSLLLTDPNLIPDELFPYLCESFGLEYFPDIDIEYQRRFLFNFGELSKRRGTFSSVHYLTRALTGLESELSVEDNVLNIVLLVKDIEQSKNIEPSRKVIENYISTQVPYYITPNISSKLAVQTITPKFYVKSALCSSKKYALNSNKEVR